MLGRRGNLTQEGGRERRLISYIDGVTYLIKITHVHVVFKSDSMSENLPNQSECTKSKVGCTNIWSAQVTQSPAERISDQTTTIKEGTRLVDCGWVILHDGTFSVPPPPPPMLPPCLPPSPHRTHRSNVRPRAPVISSHGRHDTASSGRGLSQSWRELLQG